MIERAYGWTDINKHEIPIGRVIMVRLSIRPEHRAKYGGKWFLPINCVRFDNIYLISENGEIWRKVSDPKDSASHKFQWRDIPGTPTKQAIHIAKYVQEQWI